MIVGRPSSKVARGTSSAEATSLEPDGKPSAWEEPLDLTYPGGKGLAGLAEWIAALLPPHVFYAEPFAGKAGVLRYKTPALRSYLIDRDEEILNWWRRLALPGVIVTCGDGIRWCELAAEWAPGDLLVYCDPPYVPETRVKQRIYRHEMSRRDHERLLDALTACRCGVAISGYSSPLYERRLDVWNRSTRWVTTRGSLREEVLWTNAPAATSPLAMEYAALAGSWRERDRINRKVERWASRFLAMPPAERTAVLFRLLDVQGGRRSRKHAEHLAAERDQRELVELEIQRSPLFADQIRAEEVLAREREKDSLAKNH